MTDLIKRLNDLKTKIEALEKEVIKAEAKRDQGHEQLKARGLNSLEEAREWIAKKRQEREEVKAQAEALLTRMEEEFRDFI